MTSVLQGRRVRDGGEGGSGGANKVLKRMIEDELARVRKKGRSKQNYTTGMLITFQMYIIIRLPEFELMVTSTKGYCILCINKGSKSCSADKGNTFLLSRNKFGIITDF